MPIEPVTVSGAAQILVGVRRDPVAARGGHAAHRHDDGLARLADELALPPDDLGGERAPAPAVHAQDDRLTASSSRARRRRRAVESPRSSPGLVAVEDVALGHDDRHRGPLAGGPRAVAPFAWR